MNDSSQAQPVAKGGHAAQVWALVGTALVSVLLVLVNYVSFRRFERWDLTRDGLFTLSDRTEQLLRGLEKPVDVYLFMSSGEPNFQELKELISRYRAKSDKITAHFVDPDREPSKFRMLAEQFGVRVALQESGQTEAELAALVTSGDKRWSITRDDLVDLDLSSIEDGPGKTKVDVKTEQALSGAILQVVSGRATKLCVTNGHGEWTLDGSERSLFAMKEELKRENVEVEALATRGVSTLPQHCDAIYVLGPQKAFAEDEAKALEAYLQAGGNLLLALDPIISGAEVLSTGLEGLAEAHGVKVSADVVVELDTQRLLSSSPVEHFLVLDFTDHQTMRPLGVLGAPVVMQLARSLSVVDGSDAQALLRSSGKAYGESNLSQLTAGDELVAGAGDKQGPLALGAAVSVSKGDAEAKPASKGGRMIVLGDSDWLAPTYLQQPQLANVDLLSSLTGFLTERDALVSIAPRKLDAQSVMITEEGLLGILLRVVVFMPLAALVLGVGVWWQRRS